MREILFRAWIKSKNKMVDVSSIHLGTCKIIYGYSEGKQHYGNRSCSFGDCELMQFTGLYDKNGKRIFEGDIVSYSNAIANYQVMWGNCGFVIKDKYGLLITPTQKAVDYLKVEVIGNVYDNPELIKGE